MNALTRTRLRETVPHCTLDILFSMRRLEMLTGEGTCRDRLITSFMGAAKVQHSKRCTAHAVIQRRRGCTNVQPWQRAFEPRLNI